MNTAGMDGVMDVAEPLPVESQPGIPGATGATGDAAGSLRDRGRMLSLLISNLPGVVYRCRNDADWTMEFVSDGCLALTGYPAADLIGNRRISYNEVIHVDDRDWLWEKCQRSLEEREPCRNEYRIVTASGEERWVCEQASGVYDEDGTLLAIEGFIQDITERKQAEASLRLALNELDHRVRNNLAAVLALANYTMSTTTSREEFAVAFAGRIQAMARSHQAMAVCKARGMDIGALVRETLAPFDRGQVLLEGEPIGLPPRAAVPVTLVLHEMATNALKHGALSEPGGRVEVRWHVDGGVLRLGWTERDGPPVSSPVGDGAGVRLIHGFVQKELGGVVHAAFCPAGVQYALEIPVVTEAAGAGTSAPALRPGAR